MHPCTLPSNITSHSCLDGNARTLDVAASPYDASEFEIAPVAVETATPGLSSCICCTHASARLRAASSSKPGALRSNCAA